MESLKGFISSFLKAVSGRLWRDGRLFGIGSYVAIAAGKIWSPRPVHLLMEACAPGGGGHAAVVRRDPDGSVKPRRVRSGSNEVGGPSRTNGEWACALADDGPAGEAAQRDLRAILVSGLRRVLALRGVSGDLCEDLAQEALVRIRDRMGAFRGESRFTTWALAIATRVAFDELRHKRWQDVSFEAVAADAQVARPLQSAPDASQEKALVRERVLAALRDIIENKLTDKQRSVVVAELNGMPHVEIARALGMNRNAVYKLSHDARRKVKGHLESAGLSEDEVLWVFD